MEKLAGSLINGRWVSEDRELIDIINPADGKVLSQLPIVTEQDLDDALKAADNGFSVWRKTTAWQRYNILRNAASELRLKADEIALSIVLEQGKPLSEAKMEAANAADIIDWYAEESRRAYGRNIPARAEDVRQQVIPVPVGPVAAFSPWNFPLGQSVRKVAAALAAGCSVIIKPPEECPSCNIALAQAFESAGLPAGVLNMVFGDPQMISSYLIPSPVIKKVTFTGSVPVGKHLSQLSAKYLKRTTMELGGHAPFIVCEDADLPQVIRLAVTTKFRNAGQVCVSPTRFYIHRAVYQEFLDGFIALTRDIVIGAGSDPETTMGPLANTRRVSSCHDLVEDARQKGAQVICHHDVPDNNGCFFPPTILTGLTDDARVLSEEPFGPLASLMVFDDIEDVISRANALPFGLAAYAFTRSGWLAEKFAAGLDAGMVSINHFGLALPETPFGGIKDSGYGSEGGSEGLEAYQVPKFITERLLP